MVIAASLLLLCSALGPALATPVVQSLAGPPRTPVSSAVYDNLVYYAPFPPAAGVGPSCAIPPRGTVLQQFINISSTDTQVALYRSDARREFVLSIPGTEGNRDIVTDLVFLPVPYLGCALCTVHAGFLGAWTSAAPTVRAALTSALASRPGYSVVIVGHSLGAALADLAFADLAPDRAFRIREAYTYGGPRVGNLAFAEHIDRLAGASNANPGTHYRVTHSDDPIPHLPPGLVGTFVHPRTEYWEADDSTGNPSLGTTYRCFGKEPRDCANSQTPNLQGTAHTTYAGWQYNCNTGGPP